MRILRFIVTFILGAIVLILPQAALAQQYYGVPIENGGVAFLLDTSGSMDNRAEKIEAVAQSLLRGIAAGIKGTAAGQSKIGQALIQKAEHGMPPVTPKLESARKELMHALDSLAPGTNFTIITFGDHASEWPGGVRPANPSSMALAREYVAGLSAA